MEMARQHNKMQYWALRQAEGGFAVSFEKPTNTGDGIRMGMEIGAATDFSDACVMIPTLYPGGVTDYWSVDHPGTTTNKYGSAQLPGSIIVNNRGNRFVQEDGMWGMIMGRIYREIIVKSAKKRILVTETRTARNKAIKSEVKTMVKKVYAAIDSKDQEAAKAALKAAISTLDKATTKGVYHKNTTSRKISRLQTAVNKMA